MKHIKMLGLLLLIVGTLSSAQVRAADKVDIKAVASKSISEVNGMLPSVAIPVPEPSDWAWLPVLGTAGILVWRRFGRKVSA